MPAVTVPPITLSAKISFTGREFAHLGKRFLINKNLFRNYEITTRNRQATRTGDELKFSTPNDEKGRFENC